MTTQTRNVSHKLRQISWGNLILPRLEDILFLAIFVSVIGLGPRLLNMDGDLGRHITIGNYIIENLSIPTRDIFSHSMTGEPLTPHEWLAQVLFAFSYRIGGLNGVVVFCALLIAITSTLTFRQCVTRSKMLLISLVFTILAAAAASIHWLSRPHLFTMLLTVLWIGELERWRVDGRWRWWVLPLLMLLWVNLHGAFIVGIVIWGIYLVDSIFSNQRILDKHRNHSIDQKIDNLIPIQLNKSFQIGFVIIFVTLLNPVGWRIYDTAIGFLRSRYLVSHTVEYLPPNFQQFSSWPFLAMLGFSILLLSLKQRRISVAAALLLSSWTVFGLISARNIPIYAVVAAPILAGIGSSILIADDRSQTIKKIEKRLLSVDRNLIGYIWPMISILIVVGFLFSGVTLDFIKTGNEFSEDIFPVEAVDWVSQQPVMGSVFNYFPWGGYLLYRTWPHYQVFIDGQTDFYGEQLTREYEKVISLSEGWNEILEKYEIHWIIMPEDAKLVEALEDHPKWMKKYQDASAVIFIADQ